MSRAFSALTLALSLLAACNSTSDKGASTGKTVDQAAAEIGQTITHLDATLVALKDLVKNPAADLTAQSKLFTKSLGSLESSAKKVAELASEIDTKSQDYFAQWDTQIASVQNEDIRERTAERRETVSKNFQKLKEEYVDVREGFKPLLDDLRDVRTFLANDLTVDGLKTIKGTVEDIADESGDVRESLDELHKRFQELGVKLSRANPAAVVPAEPAK